MCGRVQRSNRKTQRRQNPQSPSKTINGLVGGLETWRTKGMRQFRLRTFSRQPGLKTGFCAPQNRLDADRATDYLLRATLMNIAIGSDHAGFQYKEKIKTFLTSRGHSVKDFGTDSDAPVDYPRFIRPVAEAVARGECERGIVLGGSGNGEAITANRVKGIRCALCWNLDSARLGRQHNNANMISLGQRMMTAEMALEIVGIWLDTPFEGGRHQRRIELIDEA